MSEIMKRDQEDGDKLAKGIQLAIDKKVLPADVKVEPITKISVSGKSVAWTKFNNTHISYIDVFNAPQVCQNLGDVVRIANGAVAEWQEAKTSCGIQDPFFGWPWKFPLQVATLSCHTFPPDLGPSKSMAAIQNCQNYRCTVVECQKKGHDSACYLCPGSPSSLGKVPFQG